MLEAIPTTIFSNKFTLRQQHELVGEVDTSVWREKARLEAEEGTFDFYRESLFSGEFVLERGGKVIARASKPSVFQHRFEVDLAARHVVLRKPSVWGRRFGVFEGGDQIGSIYPVGLFTRRSNIDLPADWPLPVRVFLFWLAFILWRREAALVA